VKLFPVSIIKAFLAAKVSIVAEKYGSIIVEC